MYMLKLNTKNTRYGNPRALYVLYNESIGTPVQAWDIGYAGICAVPEMYRDLAAKAAYIPTTPQHYQLMKKMFAR